MNLCTEYTVHKSTRRYVSQEPLCVIYYEVTVRISAVPVCPKNENKLSENNVRNVLNFKKIIPRAHVSPVRLYARG